MLELSTKLSRRVEFRPGKQKEFLELVRNKLEIKNKYLAKLIGVSTKTLNDWKRGKYCMAFDSLKFLCKKAGITIPVDIKTKDRFWYVSMGAKTGWIAVYKKYGYLGGDPEKRKKKWYEWWEKEGQFKKHPIINVPAPVKLPARSRELAEFIGILLGDGGITRRQITITLHRIDDKKYAQYVQNLIDSLFELKPSLYARRKENVINITVSRSRLVRFFVKMGLHIGSKVRNQTDIPTWIKKSNNFSTTCLKGLFDTDGCLYIDKHRIKDRVYLNAGMNFTNRSLPILSFFKMNLEKLGYHPTQRTNFSIFLRKEAEIIRYFKEIGSANSKYWEKLNKFLKNKYGEVPKWS